MSDLLLSLLAGSLPQGACYTSEPERLVAYANALQAVLPNGRSFFNFGANKPAPEYQIYPWLYTGDMEWYRYSGVWYRPHPVLPNSQERRMFYGTEPEVWAYDGGDGTNPATSIPTVNAGAMWEVDTNFAGRSPMGPGTISGSDPAKVLAQGEAYGVAQQLITGANLPSDTLTVAVREALGTDFDPPDPSDPHRFLADPAASGLPSTSLDVSNSSTTTDQPLSVVHPVRGIWVIKRTARVNIVIP